MNMYHYRRQRLLNLIDSRFQGVRKSVSDASGWSEARISQILSPTYREGRAFSEKIARKLEDDLKLDKMYFDQGAAPSGPAIEVNYLAPFQPVRISEDHPNEHVQIRQVHLRLSAGIMGFQADTDYENGATFTVDLDWIKRNRFDPEKLIAIRVKGESMEPSLYHGDLLVVNTGDNRLVDGEVYAVNYEGEAVVKRLSRDASQWWLTSDNPDKRRYHRKLCEGDACLIVGRVVLKKSERI